VFLPSFIAGGRRRRKTKEEEKEGGRRLPRHNIIIQKEIKRKAKKVLTILK
jgi:hypothetical protein